MFYLMIICGICLLAICVLFSGIFIGIWDAQEKAAKQKQNARFIALVLSILIILGGVTLFVNLPYLTMLNGLLIYSSYVLYRCLEYISKRRKAKR